MKYRNINTGEIWALEEIQKAYEQFQHETTKSLEETMEDFEEAYWYAVLRNKSAWKKSIRRIFNELYNKIPLYRRKLRLGYTYF